MSIKINQEIKLIIHCIDETGIMTKISSVSSENQLLMLKNAPEFTKIMIGEICTSL